VSSFAAVLCACTFAVVALLGVGAVSAPPANAATTVVHLSSAFVFSPAAVTIHVGDTVEWEHDSSTVMHTVTADDGSFNSSPSCPATPSNCLGANATFSHTFSTAGTFRYYCKIHGAPGGVGMSGTITVLAATPTSTTPTTSATGATIPQSTGGAPTSAAPGATAAPAATPSASLPRTGSNTVPLLLAGAAAIALGGLAMTTRRRARPTR
jgi:LPXTG-motif cell wall-anchored protein